MIEIGDDTFINHGCFLDGSAPIILGRRCSLGYSVMLATSTHSIGGPEARAGADVSKSITLGDGVWVGARATLLAGVSVGSGCVIAAGSVVTTDCDPNGLYAGVPARKVRDLTTPLGGQDGIE